MFIAQRSWLLFPPKEAATSSNNVMDKTRICSRKNVRNLVNYHLSNHNDIWKQRILKLFCKQANKSQDLTMQPLKIFQCNYSNWGTWKQTIPPCCSLKTKILKLFYKRTNKTQGSTTQPLKYRLNLPDLSGKSPQIHECYWFVCKKTRESSVFRNHSDWTIFF